VRAGYITLNDLRLHFKERGEKVDESLLHELLNEVDLDKNGQVQMIEWLQVRTCCRKQVMHG
jgi:glycerol-3-phosphate dehydrogenase